MRACAIFGLLLAACNGSPAASPPSVCDIFGDSTEVPVPATCRTDVSGDGETVRVFAVGPVIRYAEMVDYASFCHAWDDVVRTEVLPCLANDKPNLLVLPENASLAAAFIGSRGEAARAESESIAGFASLITGYQGPFAEYGERFPNLVLGDRLVVSVTDTLYRAFQTFHEIARRYEVYVAVSSDFAPATLSSEPDEVSLFADPDLPNVSSVYVADEGAAFNFGIVIGPDGEEIGRTAKSYLVPAEEELLALTHGALEQMEPIALPFGPRIGMVISKDAWMPDVLHRFDLLGANLMLQPEAFSGWGVFEFEGDWLPDIVRQSGWAHTQRHGAFRYNVVPCIKGNLLDLVFDCQSHISTVAREDDTPGALIGQEDYLGLLSVEPWVIEDPGPPTPLDLRRTFLRDRGTRMLPGSGDPLEDAYAHQVIAADLSLPADGAVPATGDGTAGSMGPSVALRDPEIEGTQQRFVDIAASGSRVLVAWMEGAPGRERVRAFFGEAGIESLQEVTLISDGGLGRAPSVAVTADTALIAWEESRNGLEGVVAGLLRGGGEWEFVAVSDPGISDGWEPDAAIDASNGNAFVAWRDLRDGGRAKPFVARNLGEGWLRSRVEPDNTIDDNPRGNAAFVRVVASDGTVHVAFADFREFSWDVYLVESDDAGATFSMPVRINTEAARVIPASGGADVESERLHGDVALALDSTGSPLVAWTERQDRRYESRVALWREGVVIRVDDAPAGADSWRPNILALENGSVLVTWQDRRSASNQVRVATLPTGMDAFGPSARVDDAATDGQTYLPAIAETDSTLLVAWEDMRSGYARVRITEREK